MNSWLSPRFLIALIVAVGGAIVAGQIAGPIERIIIVLISMLVALFIAADPHDPESEAGTQSDAGKVIGARC